MREQQQSSISRDLRAVLDRNEEEPLGTQEGVHILATLQERRCDISEGVGLQLREEQLALTIVPFALGSRSTQAHEIFTL